MTAAPATPLATKRSVVPSPATVSTTAVIPLPHISAMYTRISFSLPKLISANFFMCPAILPSAAPALSKRLKSNNSIIVDRPEGSSLNS